MRCLNSERYLINGVIALCRSMQIKAGWIPGLLLSWLRSVVIGFHGKTTVLRDVLHIHSVMRCIHSVTSADCWQICIAVFVAGNTAVSELIHIAV